MMGFSKPLTSSHVDLSSPPCPDATDAQSCCRARPCEQRAPLRYSWSFYPHPGSSSVTAKVARAAAARVSGIRVQNTRGAALRDHADVLFPRPGAVSNLRAQRTLNKA